MMTTITQPCNLSLPASTERGASQLVAAVMVAQVLAPTAQ